MSALFATTLPDVNDRTLACVDRLGGVWDHAAHALQQVSAFAHRHEKAARYGEATDEAPQQIEAIRIRLDAIREQLMTLAAEAQKGTPK